MYTYYEKASENQNYEKRKYIENQYEDLSDGGRFYYGMNVEARYIKQDIPEYRGNMLIEALPPTYEINEVIPKLIRLPIYDEEEKNRGNLYREQAIYRLSDCVIPFTKYIDIEKKLAILIRRGYVGRKVMTKEFTKTMYANSEVLKKGIKNKYKEMRSIANNTCAPFPGFALIGISGGGKLLF